MQSLRSRSSLCTFLSTEGGVRACIAIYMIYSPAVNNPDDNLSAANENSTLQVRCKTSLPIMQYLSFKNGPYYLCLYAFIKYFSFVKLSTEKKFSFYTRSIEMKFLKKISPFLNRKLLSWNIKQIMHIREGVRTKPDCRTSKRTSESVSQLGKHSEIEIWYSGMNIWLMDNLIQLTQISNPFTHSYNSTM